MKRFHIHLGVKDLQKSIEFYTTLFGQNPTKTKEDYAKWMLEDPRINFAISTRSGEKGINHLGLQVDEETELEQMIRRLKSADLGVHDEGETTCCYAESKKAWVQDPTGIAWEAYRTMADAELFSRESESQEGESACCVPESNNGKSDSACCG